MTTIPPLETEDQALALPEVAAIYARARETNMRGAIAAGNLAMLSAVLRDAGVELGAYDVRKLDWLASWTPETVASVAGWISRAHEAGQAARRAEPAAVPAAAETGEDDTDG